MKLHFGHPDHIGCFRFLRGTIMAKGYPDQACYFEHPIRWMFGVSFARLFVGIVRTDLTRDVRAAVSSQQDTKR